MNELTKSIKRLSVATKGSRLEGYDDRAIEVIDKISDLLIISHDRVAEDRNVEFEISLGVFTQKGFVSGVNRQSFSLLRAKFDRDYTDRIKETSYVEIGTIDGKNVRRIKTGDRFLYETKTRITEYDISSEPFGNVRIRVSTEDPLLLTENDKRGFIVTASRERTRYSYQITNSLTADLTIVNSVIGGKASTTYEVELEVHVERIDIKGPSIDSLSSAIFDVIKFVNRYLYKSKKDVVSPITKRYIHSFLENPTSSMKYSPTHLNPSGELKSKVVWNKPINITLEALLYMTNETFITAKLDGERKLMVCLPSPSNSVGATDGIRKIDIFLVSPSRQIDLDVIKFGTIPFSDEVAYTLIDGEFYKGVYYAFDIMVFKSFIATTDAFPKRLFMLEETMDWIVKTSDADSALKTKCVMKRYYRNNVYYQPGSYGTSPYNLYGAINSVIDETHTNTASLEYDGIIFQSGGSYDQTNYKWKPSDLMTIDFLVRDKILYVKDSVGVSPFTTEGGKTYTIDGDYNGKIIEAKWDYASKRFYFYRLREDKDVPNFIDVATSVFRDITNPISEATICGKSTNLVRKYHNLIKGSMLASSKSKTIIDIGSGRGGDLMKWNKLAMTNVLCVEPNRSNATILFNRAKEMNLTPNVFMYPTFPGIEDTATIRRYVESTPASEIDCVVAFFSLTYMMETKTKYQSFLNTIRYLKGISPKLKFVGMVMDGQKVASVLGDSGKFENDIIDIRRVASSRENEIVITIKTESDGSENIGTTTTKVMVENQTEWLFFTSQFANDMMTMGFKVMEMKSLTNTMLPKPVNLPQSSAVYNSLNTSFIFY